MPSIFDFFTAGAMTSNSPNSILGYAKNLNQIFVTSRGGGNNFLSKWNTVTHVVDVFQTAGSNLFPNANKPAAWVIDEDGQMYGSNGNTAVKMDASQATLHTIFNAWPTFENCYYGKLITVGGVRYWYGLSDTQVVGFDVSGTGLTGQGKANFAFSISSTSHFGIQFDASGRVWAFGCPSIVANGNATILMIDPTGGHSGITGFYNTTATYWYAPTEAITFAVAASGTYTMTCTNTFSAGDKVMIWGLSGGFTGLNSTVQTVISTGLSGSQFEFTTGGSTITGASQLTGLASKSVYGQPEAMFYSGADDTLVFFTDQNYLVKWDLVSHSIISANLIGNISATVTDCSTVSSVSTYTYTGAFSDGPPLVAGMVISVTGMSNGNNNISNRLITVLGANTFAVASTTQSAGTNESGATGLGKVIIVSDEREAQSVSRFTTTGNIWMAGANDNSVFIYNLASMKYVSTFDETTYGPAGVGFDASGFGFIPEAGILVSGRNNPPFTNNFWDFYVQIIVPGISGFSIVPSFRGAPKPPETPQGTRLDLGQMLKAMSNVHPMLSEALSRLQDGVNSIAENVNVSAVGKMPPPPPLQAVTVKAVGETVHVAIDHNLPVQKGIHYYTEIDTDPGFPQPIVHDHGASRTSPPFTLPAKDDNGDPVTYYVRSYAQYRGSDPTSKVAFGGNKPTAITLTGSTQMTLLPSKGSGTASPQGTQGGQGAGVDLIRVRLGPKRSPMN